MTCQSKERQPSLFEGPRIELPPARRAELSAAVEAMLREIVAALVDAKRRESGHEQNHG
jgi:hypothetical protein